MKGTLEGDDIGALGLTLQAATAWGLSEFFVLKRRMALPAIVLLLVFVGGVYLTGLALLEGHEGYDIILAGGLASVAAWLHWRRFKVPITVAAGMGALSVLVIGTLLQMIPAIREWVLLLVLIAGVGVFVLAMRWDFSDRVRETGRSDVAFWLHLLAAPMMIHPVFTVAAHGGEPSLGQALVVVGLYLLIAWVSLLIDRRALMVSALGYVLYAFSNLLKLYGVVSLGFAFTALAIGGLLLLLSAFWHGARQGVVSRMPVGWQERLPPLR